jgi:hypothetical protein
MWSIEFAPIPLPGVTLPRRINLMAGPLDEDRRTFATRWQAQSGLEAGGDNNCPRP